jgi:hypothetical protein
MRLSYLSPPLLFAATVWSEIQSREDLYTRLVGYDGCTCCPVDQKKIIKVAWQQSWDVMDVIREVEEINWNEAAALDYLGPPSFNVQYQATIQEIFTNLGTMNGHWAESPFDWSINVRCDDWLHLCGTSTDAHVAYTEDTGPRRIATINFCDKIFKSPDLIRQVSRGQKSSNYLQKYNMVSYANSTGEALHWSRKKYCLPKY